MCLPSRRNCPQPRQSRHVFCPVLQLRILGVRNVFSVVAGTKASRSLSILSFICHEQFRHILLVWFVPSSELPGTFRAGRFRPAGLTEAPPTATCSYQTLCPTTCRTPRRSPFGTQFRARSLAPMVHTGSVLQALRRRVSSPLSRPWATML